MTTTDKYRITINVSGDTLSGLWSEYDEPRADERADDRLDYYVNRAETLCRARWPEAEIIVDHSQIRCTGATRPDSIERLDDEYGWDDGPDDADELRDILMGAYSDACEYEPEEMT